MTIMTMPEIRTVTNEDLLAERAAIYRAWDLDAREFRPIEDWRELFLEEHLARLRLDDISFFLGDRPR
jgi:hypothetical protein